MDKAPAYGAGDSGFESQYGLHSFSIFSWPGSARFLSPCSRRYAQTDQPIPESFVLSVELTKKVIEQKKGVMRESNSRPPAPEAGIIPLDQSPGSQDVTAQRRDMNAGAKEKGRAGVEPATYRAATNCSTTELTPQRQCQRRW
jgi:hypothetical protein